jgi:CBS domain containing-hemolysin-like protein
MLELTLALISLALSSFFSGSELAYISANPLQMEVWFRQKRRGASSALKMLENPDYFLVGVLIGTTLSNVIATSFATTYLIQYNWHPLLALCVITATILLFGEVLPKTITGERPNHSLRIIAPLQRLWLLLLLPLAIPLRKIRDQLQSNESSDFGHQNKIALERKDLKILFASQQDSHVLLDSEKELITQVFDLGETPVSRAMTSRTEICAVAEKDTLEHVLHTFIESGYSKLPVYRENLDNIVGVVYLYDLFQNPATLASITHPVLMVPDSNTTMDVLRQLQRAHRSITIVLDEFGGTAGLVTPEDLFEELFGEFDDEFDTHIADAARMSDGSILVDGRTKIEDLNSRFQMAIPEGEYETIAGYLTATLDRIPHTGERIYLPLGQVVIKKSSPRRIEQIQIYGKDLNAINQLPAR